MTSYISTSWSPQLISSQCLTWDTIAPVSVPLFSLQSHNGGAWKQGSIDTSRRQGGFGTVWFSGLNRIHGFRPPRPWATYPNVDHALVTNTSEKLSRNISAKAFLSCTLSSVLCSPSWLGWKTPIKSPLTVRCSQYTLLKFSDRVFWF